MLFLVESIIACVVFTLFVFLMSRDPKKMVYNYPPIIIERCKSLGLVDESNRPGGVTFYVKKITAMAIFVIPGTEDMVKDYHDYWFHIKGGFIGMLLAIPAALVAGLITIL